MLSILKFSGKQWSRAAFAWLVFMVTVDGLADAGAEAADARRTAHHAAVALGVLEPARRLAPEGSYQVPKVEVVDLDLQRLDAAAFGDADESVSRH